jgi:hypothetical protein
MALPIALIGIVNPEDLKSGISENMFNAQL